MSDVKVITAATAIEMLIKCHPGDMRLKPVRVECDLPQCRGRGKRKMRKFK